MKIRNLLSALMLTSVIAAPVLISNTAQASDRCDNGYARYYEYKHGYYDGRRAAREERRHRRHHRKHHREHHYKHDYRPYRTHGHKHRRYGHHTGIDLIFRF